MKSLADLNIAAKCDQGFEFEYIDENGKPSGIFLTVIGGHSDKLKKASFEAYDRHATRSAMLRKMGKDEGVTPLAESAAENRAITAMRVIGWRGITEPCTPENVILLLSTNALVAKQIVEQSENIGNFTQGKSKN